MPLPTDANVLTFLASQNTLRGRQSTHRLMHIAEGGPGSMTMGGRLHSETAHQLNVLNLTGLIYAIQQGWLDPAEITLGSEPFAGVDDVDWTVEQA